MAPSPSISALLVLATCLLKSVPVARADDAISPGFPYGSEKVRGVNIGGWLVLEPWITPSLFDNTGNDAIVDEWTFCEMQSTDTARAALRNHWDSFYSEDDFAAIAAAGLNHVRIPIGYWAFDVGSGEPYIQGQVPYLQKAVDWARSHGLKVIVDLHGAPGSQNGFDNSGQKMGYPQWQSSQNNVDRTNAVLKSIANMFASDTDVVPVIAPLNEPAGYYGEVLSTTKQYWRDSYGNIRFPFGNDRQSDTVVLIHDAFQGVSSWRGFMPTPDYQGVAIDTHIYQVFSDDEVAESEQQHIDSACSHAGDLSSFELWTIVGEFAPARTDCAKYLNGRGVGARYDGSYPGSSYVGSCNGVSGSADSFNDGYKTFLRKFWEAQISTYENGAGWVQWLWKTESGTGEEWSYKAGLDHGWIPQNPTDRQYPDICG